MAATLFVILLLVTVISGLRASRKYSGRHLYGVISEDEDRIVMECVACEHRLVLHKRDIRRDDDA